MFTSFRAPLGLDSRPASSMRLPDRSRVESDISIGCSLQVVNGSYQWQVAYRLEQSTGSALSATLQQLYPQSVSGAEQTVRRLSRDRVHNCFCDCTYTLSTCKSSAGSKAPPVCCTFCAPAQHVLLRHCGPGDLPPPFRFHRIILGVSG